LSRGHEVVGVVRDPAAVQPPDPRVRLVKGDATRAEDVARVVRGADAAVSAISPRPNARGLPAPSLAANARALIAGLRAAGVKRVLYVGGASSLEVAPGKVLADQPGFPDASKAEAREGRQRCPSGAARPRDSTGPTSARPKRSARVSAPGSTGRRETGC
jgi:putative NADH-flavin reductase